MSEQLHLSFYRATACNATHGIAVSEMSVRPSVKRMDCDNTKKKLLVLTFLYGLNHMKERPS